MRPLLSAYTQVNDKIQATLLIVRDVRAGDNRQIFEEFKQLHPDMQTMVTGYVSPDDLAAYYSFRDVFVQPSLRDGLANALLEAMACEKVVIGPCARGIPDAVSDCENGRLVSTNDADKLPNTIIKLWTSEHLQRKLGGTARQTIMPKFTSQAALDGNLAIDHRLGLKV